MSPLKINNNVVSIKKQNVKPIIKIEKSYNLIEDKNVVNKIQESSTKMNIKADAKNIFNNNIEYQLCR
jgi:hypothetical protein